MLQPEIVEMPRQMVTDVVFLLAMASAAERLQTIPGLQVDVGNSPRVPRVSAMDSEPMSGQDCDLCHRRRTDQREEAIRVNMIGHKH